MFGSHLSIAGGLHNALLSAASLQCDTVQIFTRNQQQWAIKPLDPAAVSEFKTHAQRLHFQQIIAHDSYLINLAAKDPAHREKSILTFAEELRRCHALGITHLVTHPGAHVGQGEDCGLDCMIQSFNAVTAHTPHVSTIITLETTAGQGSCLGHRFEHLAAILNGVKRKDRFAVCLDTAHVLAAGYDITTADGTREMFARFDQIVGLQHLAVLHLNDSKKPLASRVDRHEHIGRGHVGLPAFAVIARDRRFRHLPKILETPKDDAPNGKPWDSINLHILRTLAAGRTPSLALRR